MLNLIMPMAGRGSRFSAVGESVPKPLIQIHGKPFFYWAANSVLHAAKGAEITFVVLSEHIRSHSIDAVIMNEFPSARIVAVDKPTAGALESAMIALHTISPDLPVLINDCDHAFRSTQLAAYVDKLRSGELDAFLCNFFSNNSAYSYAEYNEKGYLSRTAEKKVISKYAIAGAYGIKNGALLSQYIDEYRKEGRYAEMFISGIYDLMARDHCRIAGAFLDQHISFGTPEELAAAQKIDFAQVLQF